MSVFIYLISTWILQQYCLPFIWSTQNILVYYTLPSPINWARNCTQKHNTYTPYWFREFLRTVRSVQQSSHVGLTSQNAVSCVTRSNTTHISDYLTCSTCIRGPEFNVGFLGVSLLNKAKHLTTTSHLWRDSLSSNTNVNSNTQTKKDAYKSSF